MEYYTYLIEDENGNGIYLQHSTLFYNEEGDEAFNKLCEKAYNFIKSGYSIEPNILNIADHLKEHHGFWAFGYKPVSKFKLNK